MVRKEKRRLAREVLEPHHDFPVSDMDWAGADSVSGPVSGPDTLAFLAPKAPPPIPLPLLTAEEPPPVMCLFPVLRELDVVSSSSIFPLLRALEEAEEDEVTSGSGFLVRFDSLVLPVDAAVFFFLFLFPTLAEREIEGEAGEVNEQKEKVKCHVSSYLSNGKLRILFRCQFVLQVR